jgi:hypothetical protein
MAYLQCDKCGKSTNTQGSWDTPITILCEECSKNREDKSINEIELENDTDFIQDLGWLT